MTTIYDFGSNNGDDIPYYLLKADKVVAVEANPSLAEIIAQRFSKEISEGRVIVENVAVTEFESREPIRFFVHLKNHVLSTTIDPGPVNAEEFEVVLVESKAAHTLVAEHGHPFYIKIDLEGLDSDILRSLFRHSIFPHYISAEGHDPAILGLIHGLGGYQRFKVVEGQDVGRKLSRMMISTKDLEKVSYHFPKHAAGPFGNDIDGPWFDAGQLFEFLRFRGLGWYDIHAELGPSPRGSGPTIRLSEALGALLRLAFPKQISAIRRVRSQLKRAKSRMGLVAGR